MVRIPLNSTLSLLCYPSVGMQVESALLFETPEEMVERVFREVRPRTPAPKVRVEFRRFVNVNSSIRLKDGELALKISDLLERAPAPVLEALFHILVCKLFRREVPQRHQQCYRLYLNRHDVRGDVQRTRKERGWKLCAGPRGDFYDLDPLFEELNQRFFAGELAKPALGWSRQQSRTLLGHYDPSHHAIVLSKLLDGAEVPRVAVEFVLYHEMLHIVIPVEHCGGRRSVHPAKFRKAEKAFPQYTEAKGILKQLSLQAARRRRR